MDRVLPDSSSPDAVTGDDYMDVVKEKVDKLFDESFILLTNVAGTNTITADLDPELLSNLIDGMKFILTPANANTDVATLSINSGPAVDILRWDSSTLQPGDLGADQEIGLIFKTIGGVGKLKMMVPPPDAPGAKINRQVFTASGTWTKPANYSADALVIIEGWGAGGGGGNNANRGGGGGGAKKRYEAKLSDLGSTETVTIGAGGAISTAGGNSLFGSLLVAYGGGGGSSGGNGAGGGGGSLGAGASGSGNNGGVGGGPNGGATATVGGDGGFGGGGGSGGSGVSGAGGNSALGGGGGGSGTAAGNGGNSLEGGGGGASGTGTGGTSVHAGAGGNPGSAGSAPAGGGGANAVGARGEIRVTVIG